MDGSGAVQHIEVFDRIDALMKSQGKHYKALNDYLNLGKKTYDNWKNGRSTTYLNHLNEIAKFLDVTPNYLLNGIDEKAELSNVLEIEMLRLFRALDEANQKWLLEVIQKMIVGLGTVNTQ